MLALVGRTPLLLQFRCRTPHLQPMVTLYYSAKQRFAAKYGRADHAARRAKPLLPTFTPPLPESTGPACTESCLTGRFGSRAAAVVAGRGAAWCRQTTTWRALGRTWRPLPHGGRLQATGHRSRAGASGLRPPGRIAQTARRPSQAAAKGRAQGLVAWEGHHAEARRNRATGAPASSLKPAADLLEF